MVMVMVMMMVMVMVMMMMMIMEGRPDVCMDGWMHRQLAF